MTIILDSAALDLTDLPERQDDDNDVQLTIEIKSTKSQPKKTTEDKWSSSFNK